MFLNLDSNLFLEDTRVESESQNAPERDCQPRLICCRIQTVKLKWKTHAKPLATDIRRSAVQELRKDATASSLPTVLPQNPKDLMGIEPH